MNFNKSCCLLSFPASSSTKHHDLSLVYVGGSELCSSVTDSLCGPKLILLQIDLIRDLQLL